MTNTNLLMAKMVERGDKDCIAKLTELLGLSRTTASNKLNDKTPFDQNEIKLIAKKYQLSIEDIGKIFIDD